MTRVSDTSRAEPPSANLDAARAVIRPCGEMMESDG